MGEGEDISIHSDNKVNLEMDLHHNNNTQT